MQPPSLAPVATAKRICMIKPFFSLTYKFGHPPRHHHHITTLPPPRHTELPPCKVWKLTRCRRNGVQGAATRHEISGAGYHTRKGKAAATSHRGRPVGNQDAAPPPRHTELSPCKGVKRDAAPHTPTSSPGNQDAGGHTDEWPPHQAAALTGSSHTHTAPGTPPHRVTTEGGHWHRRAICLQGMEALERGRDAAALTLVALATLIHPDTATSPGTSSHRVITEGGQCAENQNIYISLQTIKINYFLMLYGRKNNIIPQSISRDFKETK